MSLEEAITLVRQTLLLSMLIAAPMLGVGLIVGVIISLLQTITQIQEQTLTFVPKIAAMVCAAIVLGPWIGQQLMAYAAAMFATGQLPMTAP
jgi:flagellar biosynthetic protein FliQ